MIDGPLTDQLRQRIALLAGDRESGASEILDEVLAVLREAAAGGRPLLPVARALVRAQPSMASVWNAALDALAGEGGGTPPAARVEQFTARVARAAVAVARFGTALFDDESGGPLRLVTMSFSRSTHTLIQAIAAAREVRVACSESRPAPEGRRLASKLAEGGIAVTFFSDAAIGHALGAADAVLVGADAVSPEWFLNKSGTRMLAAAAAHQGVPTYVVVTRDKFVSHAVAGRLIARERGAAEIWEAPPAGVTVRNPYFETTPLDLVASLITDMGVLGPSSAAEVCEAIARDQPLDLMDKI